jgi:Fe-S cluster assembly protein SufD
VDRDRRLAADTYVAEAERAAAGRVADPQWLTARRRAALHQFQALGFPTARDEEWRFTSVAPIVDTPFVLASNGASSLNSSVLEPFKLPGQAVATLVFVNGRFVPAVSNVQGLPPDVRVESFAQGLGASSGALERHLSALATADRHAFTALNTAFLVDGAFLVVPESVVLAAPIHVLFVSTSGDRRLMSHPRVLIVAGANSRASIVESYVGVDASPYFTNAVTEVLVGDNARLDHYKVQRESSRSAHVGAMYMHAGRDSSLTCHSISLGGSLVRNDVFVVLKGEGSSCTLNGLYLGDGQTLVDNHTTIDHARPHCESREVYKGILADRARGVFNGKIIVRPDAQKTDAKQTNKALLLSEDAQINTKPELEIFANDVKCTHGAAVGQMDEDAIFYLRARGFSEQHARRLLIRTFASEVLHSMPLAALGERLDRQLALRLPGGDA